VGHHNGTNDEFSVLDKELNTIDGALEIYHPKTGNIHQSKERSNGSNGSTESA
jgi:hypothetical protein